MKWGLKMRQQIPTSGVALGTLFNKVLIPYFILFSLTLAMFSRGGFSGLTFLKVICLPSDLSDLTINLGLFTGAEMHVHFRFDIS